MGKNLFIFSKNSSLLLILITLIGIFFRIENLSPFNIYPDSYQNLIVALNIKIYHDVLGYLGSNGMIYPDFFSWTHPGYPLLIDAVTIITHNMTLSARSIAFAVGILTIPLAYFFINRVFSSSVYGLAGALLVALSYNHTLWGGFIMTETTGVFFTMLFLFFLFMTIKTKASWFHWLDITLGILFFLMVITRYEYIILLVPVLFFFIVSKYPLKRIITFLLVFLLLAALMVELLFPLPSTFTIIIPQLHYILTRAWSVILAFFLLAASLYFLPQRIKSFVIIYGNFFILIFLLISVVFLKNFFIHEILLTIFSLLGYFFLLTESKKRIYGYFSLLACACLLAIYYDINPDMERYVTHIIPFLLIPASYGFVEVGKIINKKNGLMRLILLISVILLVSLQAILTIVGLKSSQDPSWYHVSYEDKTAAMTKQYIPNNDYLLITSYPEPFFYTLHLSTQSISDTYPYLFINNVPQNQKILIIEDMGMHDDFPNFTNFLNKNLSKNKIATFWVHEKFHYVATVQEEKYPVAIYKTTLRTLETKIRHK